MLQQQSMLKHVFLSLINGVVPGLAAVNELCHVSVST